MMPYQSFPKVAQASLVLKEQNLIHFLSVYLPFDFYHDANQKLSVLASSRIGCRLNIAVGENANVLARELGRLKHDVGAGPVRFELAERTTPTL